VIEALRADHGLARLLVQYSPIARPEFVPDPAYLANMPPALRAAIEAAPKQSGVTGPAGAEWLARARLTPEDLFEPFSIEKAWHGAHFALARTVYEPKEPPGDAVLGGVPIGEDLGYGPVRIKTPEEVARTFSALVPLELHALRTGLHAADLTAAGIYPGVWDSDDGALDWVIDAVSELRDFYARCASAGHGMLLCIT
jgi:hypothetical protein